VTYFTYLASEERVSYTPSIERIVEWTVCKTLPFCSKKFWPLSITSCSREKRSQALPTNFLSRPGEHRNTHEGEMQSHATCDIRKMKSTSTHRGWCLMKDL